MEYYKKYRKILSSIAVICIAALLNSCARDCCPDGTLIFKNNIIPDVESLHKIYLLKTETDSTIIRYENFEVDSFYQEMDFTLDCTQRRTDHCEGYTRVNSYTLRDSANEFIIQYHYYYNYVGNKITEESSNKLKFTLRSKFFNTDLEISEITYNPRPNSIELWLNQGEILDPSVKAIRFGSLQGLDYLIFHENIFIRALD